MTKAMKDENKLMAQLPSVDLVVHSATIPSDYRKLDHDFLIYCIRAVIDDLRKQIKLDPVKWQAATREQFMSEIGIEVQLKIEKILEPSLRRVVNGTGVILHTGLGRAPLAPSVQREIAAQTENYCNIEVDLNTGKRGERLDHVEELLCYLSGAAAAAVVNNNAGAILIALNTLAKGREVIISRGQLIEIGGSFRLPEVMAQSGAIMWEVGTTNKTYLRDYEEAINTNTGAILIAHSSNYRILGFTEEVPVADLVILAHKHHLPLIYDLGGGVFLDLNQFNLPHEPVVSDNIRLGVDVVTFSGDKVLGGPQSGILVGKEEAIRAIRNNPLMRALRCDKLIFAALAATLRLYLDPEKRLNELPIFRMLLEPLTAQRRRAEKFIKSAQKKIGQSVRLRLEEGSSEIGSGALPLAEIPSMVLRIESAQHSAEGIAKHFRQGKVPVMGYIHDDGFYLNFRTIHPNEYSYIEERLAALK